MYAHADLLTKISNIITVKFMKLQRAIRAKVPLLHTGSAAQSAWQRPGGNQKAQIAHWWLNLPEYHKSKQIYRTGTSWMTIWRNTDWDKIVIMYI